MELRETVRRFRAFNRYYTRVIGLLDRQYLDSPYTLSEVRTLYEIAHIRDCTAKRIREETGVDAGYLSRLIGSFRRRGVVLELPNPDDRRSKLLRLSPEGAAVMAELEERSERAALDSLRNLSGPEREELALAQEKIRAILGDSASPGAERLLPAGRRKE